MKALVYQGPMQKELQEKPIPEIVEETDAIVRIKKTTICGTDLHILKGDVPEVEPGTTLGHEGIGVIEETGKAVTNFKQGDLVLISCITSCGKCHYCRKAMYSHCEKGGWMLGHRINGTQAEYVRIPYADTSLYPAPPNVDEEVLVMLSDVLPTGFECGVLNGQIQPSDTVAIVGAGPIGLAALLTAQFYSPSKIFVIDHDDYRLSVAKQIGATEIVNSDKEDAVSTIMQLTDGKGVDTSIEAVGIPQTYSICEAIVTAGGHIANIGVHGQKVDLHLETLWSHNITLTTRLVDTAETPRLLKMVAAGKLAPKRLITHRFKLDQIMDAYQAFSDSSKSQALKVMIQP